MDAALDGGNNHLIGLDTSASGMKFGTITISSTSQMVQNGLITIPISYQVFTAGDYNGNGVVDAADYTVWRKTFGQNTSTFAGADGDGSGSIDPGDYQVWRNHFGEVAAGGGGTLSAVPEPNSTMLLLIGGIFAMVVRGRTARSPEMRWGDEV